MEPNELFKMILSKQKDDRILAKGIVQSLINQGEMRIIARLYRLLSNYENYPGYDIVIDKEEIEEMIEKFI